MSVNGNSDIQTEGSNSISNLKRQPQVDDETSDSAPKKPKTQSPLPEAAEKDMSLEIEADVAEDKGSRHTMEDAWVIMLDATLNSPGKLRFYVIPMTLKFEVLNCFFKSTIFIYLFFSKERNFGGFADVGILQYTMGMEGGWRRSMLRSICTLMFYMLAYHVSWCVLILFSADCLLFHLTCLDCVVNISFCPMILQLDVKAAKRAILDGMLHFASLIYNI